MTMSMCSQSPEIHLQIENQNEIQRIRQSESAKLSTHYDYHCHIEKLVVAESLSEMFTA